MDRGIFLTILIFLLTTGCDQPSINNDEFSLTPENLSKKKMVTWEHDKPSVVHKYPYKKNPIDIPLELVSGDMSWDIWKDRYGEKIRRSLAVPELAAPSEVTQSHWKTHNGIEISTASFVFNEWIITNKDGHHSGPTGLIIGRPVEPDATKPIIFAIQGHEEDHRGEIPVTYFDEGKWPLELVRKGYTVVAPSHLL